MSDIIEGIHVVAKGSRWVTTNGEVVLSRHRKKSAAIAKGRATAKQHGEQFTVHRPDGTVTETRTYANSPV